MLITTSPALADEAAAQVGAVRSDHLTIHAGADRVANSSATAIAAAGSLFHANLSVLLGPCGSVGEIVGKGPNVASVFSGFRNSPQHWSILTNPAWTAMGTGVASDSAGSMYVSVVFCAESGDSTPSRPAPSPPESSGDEESIRPSATPAPQVKPTPAGSVTILMPLPAIGARRALIRAQLDDFAQAMLPDWYTGSCDKDDRVRVLEDLESYSGACPLAH